METKGDEILLRSYLAESSKVQKSTLIKNTRH